MYHGKDDPDHGKQDEPESGKVLKTIGSLCTYDAPDEARSLTMRPMCPSFQELSQNKAKSVAFVTFVISEAEEASIHEVLASEVEFSLNRVLSGIPGASLEDVTPEASLDVDGAIASRGPANVVDLPETPGAPRDVPHLMPARSVFDTLGYQQAWENVQSEKPLSTKQ